MKNRTLSAFYLFQDKHAVAVYEKFDRESKMTLEYVEIHEQFVPDDCYMQFSGRIIFGSYSDAIVNLLKTATGIEASAPDINNGSETMKKMGIPLGHVSIYNKHGEIMFDLMPSIVASRVTYQPGDGYKEIFDPNIARWSVYNVGKIHPKN